MSSTPAPALLSEPGLVLLTTGTPNGVKVSIALEELKAVGAIPDYKFVPIKFDTNDQKTDWFLKINPNGRIPALVDNRKDKGPINVWESASILLYLARVYDKELNLHFAADSDEEQEMLNWIFFLQGGVGPMQGQANHFFRYAPEKIPYGVNRYQNETKRLYSVYEEQLASSDYLVGNKYSYADIVSIGWIRASDWAGVPLDEFPRLKAWVERIEARPAVQKGLNVPDADKIAGLRKDPKRAEEEAKKASEWIMKGQGNQEKK